MTYMDTEQRSYMQFWWHHYVLSCRHCDSYMQTDEKECSYCNFSNPNYTGKRTVKKYLGIS